MLQSVPRHGEKIVLQTLRAMLFCLDDFPARQLFPRETEFLFRPLGEKSEALAKVVHHLELQQVREKMPLGICNIPSSPRLGVLRRGEAL
jgi:hypothetical protein